MLKVWLILRTFSPAIKSLLIAQSLYGIGLGMFTVLLNLYLREIGFSETTIGKILAVQSLCAAVFSMPMGWLADKSSRKATYILGLLLSVSGYAIISFSKILSIITVGAVISGSGNGALLVSVVPYLQENCFNRQRPYIFSLNSALTWTTSILSGLMAGWLPKIMKLSDSLPGSNDEQRLKYSLWIGICFILFSFVPAIKMTKSANLNKIIDLSKYPQSIKQTIKDAENPMKLMTMFAFVNMLIGFGAGMIVPYFNLYFKDWVGASILQIGTVFALGQFGTAIGSLISPFISLRFGLVKGVVYSQILSLPFMILMAITHNFTLCALCFIFRNAFMNMCTPMSQEILMKIIPQRLRARASATNSMSWNLSWAFAMFFSGNIIKTLGYDFALILASVCYLVASIAYNKCFAHLEYKKGSFDPNIAFNKQTDKL